MGPAGSVSPIRSFDHKKCSDEDDDHFASKLAEITSYGVLSMAMGLGHRLKLFDALASVSSEDKPATAKQVAAKAALKERYVKEWLCCVACGDIIQVDESGEHFWIKDEHVLALTGPNTNPMLAYQQFFPFMAHVFPYLIEIFQKDGPLGADYSCYSEFHKHFGSFSKLLHKNHLLTDYLSLLGIRDKLERGEIDALDIGCGDGFHFAEFASHFPRSNFTAIDFSPVAIAEAENRRVEANGGLKNLRFLQMDASSLDRSWTDRFDWITVFDSCHDQMRPDLCIREVHRVLKEDGLFAMLEIEGSSNAYVDKERGGLSTALFYGLSLFHCLPVASNSPDALGLGAMWGRARAIQLLNRAGFTDIQVVPTPFFKSNVLYLCRK